jgi:hypothetical protein
VHLFLGGFGDEEHGRKVIWSQEEEEEEEISELAGYNKKSW